MKKLLLSLATVAIVVTGGVFATRAYFSDTETSVGNTFTAGTIDIAVDAIFWIGKNGKFIYINNSACSMLDYSKDELIKSSNPGVEDFFKFKHVKIVEQEYVLQ